MAVVPCPAALLLATAARIIVSPKGPPEERVRQRSRQDGTASEVEHEAGSRPSRDPLLRDGRRCTVQRSCRSPPNSGEAPLCWPHLAVCDSLRAARLVRWRQVASTPATFSLPALPSNPECTYPQTRRWKVSMSRKLAMAPATQPSTQQARTNALCEIGNVICARCATARNQEDLGQSKNPPSTKVFNCKQREMLRNLLLLRRKARRPLRLASASTTTTTIAGGANCPRCPGRLSHLHRLPTRQQSRNRRRARRNETH